MRRAVEVCDGVGDPGEQHRLDSEYINIGDQPALRHHSDLQHEYECGHERDHAVTELGVLPEVHHPLPPKRKVEMRASALRTKATASSSGTRNNRSLAFPVSTSTTASARIASLKMNSAT